MIHPDETGRHHATTEQQMWDSHARIRGAQEDLNPGPLGGEEVAWMTGIEATTPIMPMHYLVEVEWLDGEKRAYRVGGTSAAMMIDERGVLRLHLGNGDDSVPPMLVAIIPLTNVREFRKVYA